MKSSGAAARTRARRKAVFVYRRPRRVNPAGPGRGFVAIAD
jgi:hypothetical protein